MRTMSILPQRSGGLLSQLFGRMFGGRRNVFDALGYEPNVDYHLMLAKYKRQGVFSRVINTYPDNVWSRAPKIVGNPAMDLAVNGEIASNGTVIKPGYAQDIDLFHYMCRLDKLAGIGKYAVLMLGFDDVTRQEDLAKPVRKGAGRKLIFVQAYGEGDATITGWNQDPSSAEFGMPELYEIKTCLVKEMKTTIQVHASRLVHVADSNLECELYGSPIGERVYNECDDLIKISGGGAEACWLAAYKGLQLDVDKEMQFTTEDAANLKREIAEFQHGFSRVLRTRGVAVKDIGSDNVNVQPMFNVIVSEISTATGIPQRIFIGSEQGKLASEQDRQNWAVQIDNRRDLYAEPRILRPFIRKVQAAGALPEGAYEFEWPDAFVQSPLERSQTSAQVARSATNIANAMERARGIMSPEEARTVIFARRNFGAQFGNESWPHGDDVEITFPSDQKYELEKDKINAAKEAADAAAAAAEDAAQQQDNPNDNAQNQQD